MAPPSDISTSIIPTKLRLTGTQSIIANRCSPLTVERLNSDNSLAPASESTSVTLDPKTNGSFHLLNDCSDSATTSVSIDAGASSKVIYYINTTPGTYNVAASGLGTPATLSMTVGSDIAEFSFEQESFTITETNVSVGTPINIRRSLAGSSQSVTITGEDITTRPSEATLTAQVINFGPADTVKTVTFPLPGPNTGFFGDRFFKVKLSAPTNSALLGARTEATVNLLEDQIPTKFFFPQTLYSVQENAGTVSIRIQRVGGNPTVPETVNLTTLNGTAVTPTHFISGGAQTITFNPGETEKVATISIVDNAIEGDSKSFFIELKNPAAGGDLITRPWSTSKVRIIDNDDTAVCDESITGAFGGGAGTAMNPFLICSLNQLSQISADPDKNYKIMSDLDLTGFTQINTHFLGSLDGNEKVLKNFRSAGAGKRGLFVSMGSSFPSPITIRNVNLTQVYVDSSNDYAAGIVAESWDSYHTLSSNLVSGLVYSTTMAGGIMGRTIAMHDAADTFNLTHGTIHGESAGGIIGYTQNIDTPTIWIDRSYSTASVFGDGTIGGLFGNYDYPHGKFYISNSHAKGYITGTGSPANADHYAGGLVGGFVAQDGSDVSITNSFYEGVIGKATRSGGLVGKGLTFDNAKSYSAIYTGNRVQAKIEGRSNVGGLIANLSTSVDVNLSSNTVEVQVTEDASTVTTGDYFAVGGMVGYLNAYSSISVDLRDITLSNKNSIVAISNGNKGGFIGGVTLESTSHLTLSNLDNYGTINAPASQGVGGMIGSVRNGMGGHSGKLDISDAHSFGSIHGRAGVGGIVGGVELMDGLPGVPAIFTLTNVSSAGNLSAVDREVGGIIGYNSQEDYTELYISQAFSSGTITSDNKVGGIIGSSRIDGGVNTVTSLYLVSARGSLNATSSGASFMGGLVGIFNCPNTGSILIEQSYSKASLTAVGEDVGGLVDGMEIQNGSCEALITNSYSSGPITASQYIGGLVAYYKYEISNGGNFEINNSYSSSLITSTGGSAAVDGLISPWTPTDTVVLGNTFFAQDPGHNGGLPARSYSMTTANFQTLAGAPYFWNFTSIWEFKAGAQYPTLRANPEP